MGDLDGRLRLVSIGAAGAFELECAVIGDIDLLMRAVDPEQVGAGGEAAGVMRRAELVEIGRGNAGVIGILHDGAGVRGRDTATVVGVKRNGNAQGGIEGKAGFGLPTSGGLTLTVD